MSSIKHYIICVNCYFLIINQYVGKWDTKVTLKKLTLWHRRAEWLLLSIISWLSNQSFSTDECYQCL